ncbi:hypothetical protein [Piscibacillus salipiscarius]|uniref:hypothetical protein n=1 Tax=Piscibacillus salipiscarius TaxID=299480 RepID=UPI002436B172|nr:hypothetical protein [Piscibacillus salipiscarius]
MVGDDVDQSFKNEMNVLQQPIKQAQLQMAGLSTEQMQLVQQPVNYEEASVKEETETIPMEEAGGFPYEQAIPSILQGLSYSQL